MKNKKKLFLILLICAIALTGCKKQTKEPQSVYQLDARKAQHKPNTGGLSMMGQNPDGTTLAVNRSYFEKNGKPWFPLMGEFHYNRFPSQYWEEEIQKMKSAGLSIVATYIFWNAHEVPKGVWNWEGDLNLRRFVELCAKNDMYVWLRIGPWSHGEQLHGGHPDWINDMKGKRSNDSGYLEEAGKLYSQIAEQSQGLFFKDGGPIIGLQLENEYASGDQDHIAVLKKMALDKKMVPPFISITANTVFHDDEFEVLPLQGGYPYRGWEEGGGKATKDFLYANDQWILTDALGKVYYDVDMYPKGMCEQGCGSQMTYRNRFTVEPEIVEAHLQNQIGRGMNQIGYYMFHGGTQQPGLKEPGYPESYDFQAPISEFGFLRPSYKNLKILHHFANDFGNELATMAVIEPENPIRDELNTKDLRYIARVKDNHGFLFLCNSQVRVKMPDKKIRFKIHLENETLEFPRKPVTLKGESTAILPMNLKIGQVGLTYATAQPVARFDTPTGPVLILTKIEGMDVELAFDQKTISETSAKGWSQEENDGTLYLVPETPEFEPIFVQHLSGVKSTIIILDREEAENAWRTTINGQESLIISGADVMFLKKGIEFRQKGDPNINFDIFPNPSLPVFNANKEIKSSINGVYSQYQVQLENFEPRLNINKISDSETSVILPQTLPEPISDLILGIDYHGGDAIASIDGKIVTDHLYHGPAWQFGLKRYLGKKEIHFKVNEWSNEITGIPDSLVNIIRAKGPSIKKLSALPQFRAVVHFSHTDNK